MNKLKTAGLAIAMAAPLFSLAACQSNNGVLGCPNWHADEDAVGHDAIIIKDHLLYSTPAMNAAASMANDGENAASCSPPGSPGYQSLWSDTFNAYAQAGRDYVAHDYSAYTRDWNHASSLFRRVEHHWGP